MLTKRKAWIIFKDFFLPKPAKKPDNMINATKIKTAIKSPFLFNKTPIKKIMTRTPTMISNQVFDHFL